MSVVLSEPSFFSRWPDRLRHSTIILLVAGLMLCALALFGALSPVHAVIVFLCIAAAALVPWNLSAAVTPIEEAPLPPPVESPVVRAVIVGMPDPAVLLDRAGRVLHMNSAAAELAPALRRGELAQFALRTPEIVTALREAIATTEPRRAIYVDRVPVDRWLDVKISPVPVPTTFGGKDCCLLMTFHDLTPLRRVEEMRVDFVANASHELRTPLAALSGFIETLQGPARDDVRARERFLGIMQAQATRMARLIDDLLSLSRVELTAHVRPDTLVEVLPLVRQVAESLEPLARERGVTIDLTLPDQLVQIPADKDELLRVFENLIENALKYGGDGDRVLVSINPLHNHEGVPEVRFVVRDFGPGISPEHLPRLTERFYRVDDGNSRAQGGTGLGLALVKHILGRHRGRLMIESVYGQGAMFTAVFPATRSGSVT